MNVAKGLFVVFSFILLMCFCQKNATATAADSSLRAHFALEGNFADTTGNFTAGRVIGDKIGPRPGVITTNTGEGYGSVTFVEGKKGLAAEFDGSSGILLPKGLISGNIYTVSLWVKPYEITPFTTTFFGAVAGDQWISIVPAGPIGGQTMFWSGEDWYDGAAGMVIPAGQWNHLAVTIEKERVVFYVNGAEKFRGTNFPGLFTEAGGEGTFALGVNWWDPPFVGVLDEIKIYDQALSAEDILNLAGGTPEILVSDGPEFTEVSVHDPMAVRDNDTFYVFGSHLAAAKSNDLIAWLQISTHVHDNNPLVPKVYQEFGESLEWAGTDTTWAKSIIKLNGKYHMYYSVSTWGSPKSAIALATADDIEGPYKYEGMILNSGLHGDQEGERYMRAIHPNAIDPHVFYDHKGKLWMVYGSYFGGIHILEMDAETGRPYPGQGYGKRLTGGSHAPMEGPEIHYHPETGYYYLFVSFGTLAAHGGYNIRIARAENPDGPYYDPSGNDMREATGRAIQPYGARIIGNFRFVESKIGYLSPGHNSFYYDSQTGKGYIFFHSRFPGKGEAHNLRVHQILMNSEGWPVCAPHRYAGETAGACSTEEVTGIYQYVNHGKSLSAVVNESVKIELAADGTIGGTVEGEWKMTGDYTFDLSIDGIVYHGVFLEQWDNGLKKYVMTFSALSEQGTAVWGSRV